MKDLLIPILAPAFLVSVADIAEVFLGPSVLVTLLTGIEFSQLDCAPLARASKSNKQLLEAGTDAPVIVTDVAPGVAPINGAPTQVVVAFAGLATTSPAGNGESVTLTPVKGVEPALLI